MTCLTATNLRFQYALPWTLSLLSLVTLAVSLTAGEDAEKNRIHGTLESVSQIGTRRELFVDDILIDRIEGGAALRLNHPVPQEIVLNHD